MVKRGILFLLALTVMMAFAGKEEKERYMRDVTRGGNWKIVYSSAEGPQGKALEVLTEGVGREMLRERHFTTVHLLPLEKAGGTPVAGKKHRLIVGIPKENGELAKRLEPGEVPAGGYLVKALSEGSSRVVLLAGDTPEAVLWAAFDFLDVGVREMMRATYPHLNVVYDSQFYELGRTPPYSRVCRPETEVRSLFTWGHVIDDYRQFFRETARLRFNRVILWNEHPPVNAQEVVETAHAWGLKVYWGFAWGWSASDCNSSSKLDLGKMAERVVAEWRARWKPLPGDGIYFQSFTEQDNSRVDGRSVASRAVEMVNLAVKGIRAEAPGLDIVFGLHAQSVRNDIADVAKVDPSLEILWENCGGFPHYESDAGTEPELGDAILAATPRVGFAWKNQLRQDWVHWAHQAGPFLLGCAGRTLLDRDRDVTDRLQGDTLGRWLEHGREAYDLLRHQRSGEKRAVEMNAVVEYNPPFCYPTQVQAEMFFSTQDSYEDVTRRARLRTDAARRDR